MPVGDDAIKWIIPLNGDVLECFHQPGLTQTRKLLVRNGLARSVGACLSFIENSLVCLDPCCEIGSAIGISPISRSKVAEGGLNMGFMRSAIQRKLVYPTWNANSPVFLAALILMQVRSNARCDVPERSKVHQRSKTLSREGLLTTTSTREWKNLPSQ